MGKHTRRMARRALEIHTTRDDKQSQKALRNFSASFILNQSKYCTLEQMHTETDRQRKREREGVIESEKERERATFIARKLSEA